MDGLKHPVLVRLVPQQAEAPSLSDPAASRLKDSTQESTFFSSFLKRASICPALYVPFPGPDRPFPAGAAVRDVASAGSLASLCHHPPLSRPWSTTNTKGASPCFSFFRSSLFSATASSGGFQRRMYHHKQAWHLFFHRFYRSFFPSNFVL